MIPKIIFNVSSTGLGLSLAASQKIPGLVLTGVTVAGANKVTVGNSYQIFSLEEAVSLGIDATGTNAFAYNQIKAFYEEAKKGAELWFMLVLQTVTMEQMADINNVYAKKLIDDAKGKIRVLGFIKKSGTTEVITDGLDDDVKLAVVKAQALCEDAASRYQHVRCVISGNKFSGVPANLKDYATSAYNKVAILIANTDASKEACIGLMLGRLARIPNQRKISRVKDGAVAPLNAYFTSGAKVESSSTSWDAIDNKAYIFLRNFSNRSGYYFTSDKTLTAATDDFNSLARGLVMDEAVLIAYGVLVEELSDEVAVTTAGTIHPAIVKSWQANIDKQLKALMVDTGKLSGAQAVINENQNVLTTNGIVVALQLLPVGYSEFITVNIGFTTTLE
jgi:Protein of unknown function (DUF2586)